MDTKGTIVFSSGKAGDYDIWTLNLATQEIRQLTSGPYWNDCPKWSPDGKKIVFVSNRTGTPEIWLMNDDGSQQTRVTNTGRWHNTPDWSPDGKSIVCCANYDGNVDIYTMHSNGSGLQRVTDYQEIDFAPQFSPDGKTIIFTSQRSGNDDIWTYNLETKELKQITTYKGRDFSPVFSPDGAFIAFVCGDLPSSGDENLDIYLMDKNGQNRRRITRNPEADRYVSWSPDGKYLVYTSSRSSTVAERLMVLDIENMKTGKIDFDREKLNAEIDLQLPRKWGIFSLIPDALYKKIYPDQCFGTERFPDWKF